MESLSREIHATVVPDSSVCLWWLGQAGFAFKTPAGQIVYAAPYLSGAVHPEQAERLIPCD
jgi:L-ascorbate metabolism protein UlaG (beta-lactamase superfamily)